MEDQRETYPDPRIHLVDSLSLWKLCVASLCLVVTTFSADRLLTMYSDRAVQNIKAWNFVIHYSDTAAGVFLVLQMVIVIVAFGVPGRTPTIEALKRLLLPTSKPLLWGAVIGLAVSIGALPLLLLFDRHVQFVRVMLDNPASFQTIFLVFLLGLVVPIATEVVFRGIIFDVLARRTNVLVALIISSILFAYVWIIFDAGVALLIGLASALLYRRFNSLVPGIICSAVVTVFATLILFLRRLFQA